MTERLYYADARLIEFVATVVAREDEGRRIYLDRSAFYPASGGQPHDVGSLGGVPVIDVVDEDDRVAHVLGEPIHLVEGEHVAATVDWTRRFDHMQQHTGQHLLTAVFAAMRGWETVSVHFGADHATLDLATPLISQAELVDAELQANIAISENRAVTVSFEDAATVRGLRRLSDRTGPLRIVTIDALDRSACGGTHVRSTGEIGAILVRGTERIRQATRVQFVCGLRAVALARDDHLALVQIARTLGAAAQDVAGLVASQAEQIRESLSVRRRMEAELAILQARALYDAIVPDEAGWRRHIDRRAAGTLEEAKTLGMAFTTLPQSIFIATVPSPPGILVASAPDTTFDAGKLLKAALQDAGGRGGGSPRLAQGTVPDLVALERVLARLIA